MNTTELIQAYYKAFNEKRFKDMLGLLTDDVIHDTNQGGRSVGKEAFTVFLGEMDTFYDEFLDNMVIMTSADGKRASAEFICNGTYKSTCEGLPPARGQKYRLPVGCFFDIKGDKIARVTNYYNMNDWLNQVK
ncbi:ketosteroid isomerase-related protein [Peredibacter starrii]|uniref:Ketosteroid isomerase-related protein n=1 Tax=Peredibacter starrii TaxID=28202 RepID=A0AAX4HJV0_9BACT|nr:ketosteroid isomerase-related protein [Peredibacter starrii]WPU63498.1 ketosteroid isomerase-related protein [Peredibacter starrii]